MPEPQQWELDEWHRTQGAKNYPGSAQPLPGKCGADIKGQSKGLRDIGAITSRYCQRSAGAGTDHRGSGNCSWHLGNAPTHIRHAEKVKLETDFQRLSERLKTSVPPGEPEVMLAMMCARSWQWLEFLTEQLDEIEDRLTTVDAQGVEHIRAILEAFERAGGHAFEVIRFMAQHKLAERLVALEEHQARVVAQIFLTVINSNEINLDEPSRELAKRQFALGLEKAGASLEPSWHLAVPIMDAIDAEVVDA